MNINAIKDAVKALAQALQIATIFPATLLIFVNAYLFIPLSVGGDSASPNVASLTVAATLLVSYLLYALNYPVIRVFEGYKFQNDLIVGWFLARKRRHHSRIQASIDELYRWKAILENDYLGPRPDESVHRQDSRIEERSRRLHDMLVFRLANMEHQFDLHFPGLQASVLPTKLGNTIAAFESYPGNRYGIDAIAMWPRLMPILKRTDYIEFVAQEKAVLDFLLNMIVVTLILSLEGLALLWISEQGVWTLALLPVAVTFSWILYASAVIAARQWGITVRVAFDLHRHQLRRELGIRTSDTFAEEYLLWKRASAFFLIRQLGDAGMEVHSSYFSSFLSASEFDDLK